MEYRNVSLEIKNLKQGLVIWEKIRKRSTGMITQKEANAYKEAGKVIRALEAELKEALEFQEAM